MSNCPKEFRPVNGDNETDELATTSAKHGECMSNDASRFATGQTQHVHIHVSQECTIVLWLLGSFLQLAQIMLWMTESLNAPEDMSLVPGDDSREPKDNKQYITYYNRSLIDKADQSINCTGYGMLVKGTKEIRWTLSDSRNLTEILDSLNSLLRDILDLQIISDAGSLRKLLLEGTKNETELRHKAIVVADQYAQAMSHFTDTAITGLVGSGGSVCNNLGPNAQSSGSPLQHGCYSMNAVFLEAVKQMSADALMHYTEWAMAFSLLKHGLSQLLQMLSGHHQCIPLVLDRNSVSVEVLSIVIYLALDKQRRLPQDSWLELSDIEQELVHLISTVSNNTSSSVTVYPSGGRTSTNSSDIPSLTVRAVPASKTNSLQILSRPVPLARDLSISQPFSLGYSNNRLKRKKNRITSSGARRVGRNLCQLWYSVSYQLNRVSLAYAMRWKSSSPSKLMPFNCICGVTGNDSDPDASCFACRRCGILQHMDCPGTLLLRNPSIPALCSWCYIVREQLVNANNDLDCATLDFLIASNSDSLLKHVKGRKTKHSLNRSIQLANISRKELDETFTGNNDSSAPRQMSFNCVCGAIGDGPDYSMPFFYCSRCGIAQHIKCQPPGTISIIYRELLHHLKTAKCTWCSIVEGNFKHTNFTS